jgi:hypothetical protein
MAAGDRNKNNKPKDYVRHLKLTKYKTLCGKTNFGYYTTDINDVSCLNCLKINGIKTLPVPKETNQ